MIGVQAALGSCLKPHDCVQSARSLLAAAPILSDYWPWVLVSPSSSARRTGASLIAKLLEENFFKERSLTNDR
jgi:hypothetical protein